MTGTNPLLPHEIWAATGMAAFQAAVDMTTTMAAASTAMFSGKAPLASSGEPPRRSAVSSVPERNPGSRSWYKAPYRSPFDPLFWMSLGHPVDHMGDWLALMRNVGMAMPGMPMPMAPAAPTMPSADAWMGPWMSLLATMNPMLAHNSRPSSNTSVLDFASAYSTYRTAGGHASAQVITTSSPSASPSTAAAAPSWPFPMALLMPVWMR